MALVGSHLVDAGAVVLAPVVQAVVDVLLASHPGKARRTLTPGKGRVYEIGGVSREWDGDIVGAISGREKVTSRFELKEEEKKNEGKK